MIMLKNVHAKNMKKWVKMKLINVEKNKICLILQKKNMKNISQII